jgi:hypothetical protein
VGGESVFRWARRGVGGVFGASSRLPGGIWYGLWAAGWGRHVWPGRNVGWLTGRRGDSLTENEDNQNPLYYIFEIRHQEKIRKTGLVINLYSTWISKEFTEATLKTWNLEFKDYDDFVKKYGPWFSDTDIYAALRMVSNFFELLSTLLSSDLVDEDMAAKTFSIPIERTWKKIKPLVEGGRKIYSSNLYYNFENLYNKMKKREQKL